MKTFNNEIIVHRNETFSMDKIVQNKDGSPYIISNRLSNPYFLLSVSTTRYAQKDRYIKNYWLDLSNYPKFTSTQAVDLHSITTSPSSESIKYFSFEDVEYSGDVLIYGYVGDTYVEYYPDDAVFYIENGDGSKTYKYFNQNLDSSNNPIGWSDYECKIVKQFTNDDTKEWVEQSYVYSIQLVSGQSTLDFLHNACDYYNVSYDDEETELELYEKLNELGIQTDVDITRPIAKFDTVATILVPTKMSVLSNLQGGL